MRDRRRLRRLILLAGIVGTISIMIVAADRPGEQDGDQFMDAQVTYQFSLSSLSELKEASDLLVLASPTGDHEFLLRDNLQGLRMMAQDFSISQVIKGRAPGVIAVCRMDFYDALRKRPAVVVIQPQPKYGYPLYLLGLADTEGAYGIQAWCPVAGPSSRIPFERWGETFVAVVDTPGDPVQTSLEGQRLARILRSASI